MFSAVVVTYLNEEEESQLGGCIIIVVIEMTYAAPSSPFPPLELHTHRNTETNVWASLTTLISLLVPRAPEENKHKISNLL